MQRARVCVSHRLWFLHWLYFYLFFRKYYYQSPFAVNIMVLPSRYIFQLCCTTSIIWFQWLKTCGLLSFFLQKRALKSSNTKTKTPPKTEINGTLLEIVPISLSHKCFLELIPNNFDYGVIESRSENSRPAEHGSRMKMKSVRHPGHSLLQTHANKKHVRRVEPPSTVNL